MGASVGANRRRGGSDGGKERIQDRVKSRRIWGWRWSLGGRSRGQKGPEWRRRGQELERKGRGRGRGIGRGATRSSGGTEKAEDSETGGGVGLAREGGVRGAIVSRVWLGAHVVHRVGRERNAQKA